MGKGDPTFQAWQNLQGFLRQDPSRGSSKKKKAAKRAVKK